jgi:putative nucleotidyltransferase with HDIG domain
MDHVPAREGALLSLSAALEAKHAHLRGHGQRVGELAVRLGRELGDGNAFLACIRVAGLLHDVGKLVLPDGLLDKPGPLTAEERDRMRAHPAVGWDLCRRLFLAQPVLDAVLHHHERCDGSGYPSGLAGQAIPYPARVLALADAFDALTSARAYRAALGIGEAMALLRCERTAGKWDARVFGALEGVIAGGGEGGGQPG